MYLIRNIVSILLTLLLAIGSSLSSAATRKASIFEDTFQLRLGAFFPRLKSTVKLSEEGSPGDRLEFERDLGLDDSKTTLYGGATWRFAQRHQVEIEHFDLARSGRKANEREWTIGDKTLLVGGQIKSRFDVKVTRISYRYVFAESRTYSLHGIAGIHHVELEADLRLAGRVLIDGKPVSTPPEKSLSQLSKTEAPLPHFGLSYGYSWTPDWSVHASVMAFSLAYDEYEGALLEFNLTGQYQINRYIGIGGGLKYFNLDVEHDKSGKTSKFDFDYYGPTIYVTATF